MAGNICDFSTPFECTRPQMVAFDAVPSITTGGLARQCTLPDGTCRVVPASECGLMGGVVTPSSGSCPTTALNTAAQMLGMLFSGGVRSQMEVLGAPGRDGGIPPAHAAMPEWGSAGSGWYGALPVTAADFQHNAGSGSASSTSPTPSPSPACHRPATPGAVGVQTIAVKNLSTEPILGLTVTDMYHVAGKPVGASLAPGSSAPVMLQMSGDGCTWYSQRLVLNVHGAGDKNAVFFINLKNRTAQLVSSTMDRPLDAEVHYAPLSRGLTITFKS